MRAFLTNDVVGYLAVVPLIMSLTVIQFLAIADRADQIKRWLVTTSLPLFIFFALVAAGRFVVLR